MLINIMLITWNKNIALH